jgi:hypothetical protein
LAWVKAALLSRGSFKQAITTSHNFLTTQNLLQPFRLSEQILKLEGSRLGIQVAFRPELLPNWSAMAEDHGSKHMAKDLFAGAVGGIAQVLIGIMLFEFT